MKYLRNFENLSEPQIGDYVICNSESLNSIELSNFILTTLGKIVDINDDGGYLKYYVKYENIPNSISIFFYDLFGLKNDNIRRFNKKDIIVHSSDKKTVEAFLIANKFGL